MRAWKFLPALRCQGSVLSPSTLPAPPPLLRTSAQSASSPLPVTVIPYFLKNPFQTLFHLTFTTCLPSREDRHHYCHFMDEEVEATKVVFSLGLLLHSREKTFLSCLRNHHFLLTRAYQKIILKIFTQNRPVSMVRHKTRFPVTICLGNTNQFLYQPNKILLERSIWRYT